jgi:phage tail sheath gpL-like
MPISFANIPSNIKVPLYWVEVDPSMAGLPQINLRCLLIGVMTSTGTAQPDIAIPIGSQAQADAAFGEGSELSRMFKSYYANNFANEVWGLPLAEPPSAAAATGTIDVTAAPTQAGTIHLYVAGDYVPVNVLTTDDVTTIGTNIADAINADTDIPVTANATGGSVALTSVFKSVNSNEISVCMNYYGSTGGQQTPIGLDITLPANGLLSGGTGIPTWTTAISNLGEEPFEYAVMPYSDSNSLFEWDQEYGFTDIGRWGWARELFGHVISAKRGTYSGLLTFGDTQNSGVESIMGFETASPSAAYEWAAAYGAKTQRAFTNDPARPLQSLSLNQIKAAPIDQRFDFEELNSLALNGIAIQKIGSDGQPMIAREQTTYQLNLYGQPDDAYELMTTLSTLAALLRNQKAAITSKFPRHKLADDGTKFGPGQAIVTPGIIKAELINQYQIDMYNGLVEDLTNFKNYLQVERDSNDPNRVNVLYPPDLINQLRIFAVLAQFRLQYDRGVDLTVTNGPTINPPYNAASGAS